MGLKPKMICTAEVGVVSIQKDLWSKNLVQQVKVHQVASFGSSLLI